MNNLRNRAMQQKGLRYLDTVEVSVGYVLKWLDLGCFLTFALHVIAQLVQQFFRESVAQPG